MDNTDLKIGDKIYHLSNSRVAWVVEKIEHNLVFCSTLMINTLEQRKENFLITSIKKIVDTPVSTSVSVKRRNNEW